MKYIVLSTREMLGGMFHFNNISKDFKVQKAKRSNELLIRLHSKFSLRLLFSYLKSILLRPSVTCFTAVQENSCSRPQIIHQQEHCIQMKII